jgi:hypothetical protein
VRNGSRCRQREELDGDGQTVRPGPRPPNPKKGRYERARIEAILDRSLVGHVAFIDRGEPVSIPMLYARIAGRIYVHGSRASRAMRLPGRTTGSSNARSRFSRRPLGLALERP